MAEQRKTNIREIAVICSITVLMFISSMMAYFSSNDEVTNTFSSNRFDIILTETKWNPETARGVLPGDTLDKNPQITNNERTDAYVFLRVTVPCDTEMVDEDNGNPKGTKSDNVPMYKFFLYNQDGTPKFEPNFNSEQFVRTHWRPVQVNLIKDTLNKPYAYEYVYAYAEVQDGNEKLTPLKNGETTEPLFDGLHLWNFSEEGFVDNANHSVLVEAFGIQTELPGLDGTPQTKTVYWDEYVFGYNKKLAAGDKTITLFDEVQLKSFIDGKVKDDFTIGVYGYGIQAKNLKTTPMVEITKDTFTKEELTAIYTIVKNKSNAKGGGSS
ncbi:MAG: hypothetical protein V3G42_10950 [Oscillospiraceae bacterium]